MDASSIASLSALLSQTQTQQQLQISVLKTAREMTEASVLKLLDSVAPIAPAPDVSSSLGSRIDIRV